MVARLRVHLACLVEVGQTPGGRPSRSPLQDYILILCTEGWTGFVDTEGFVDIEDLVHTAGFSSHGAD